MLGDQRRNHRIHQPLIGLRPVAQQNRRVRHQVPHIAHQHQRTARKRHLGAIGRGEALVLGQLPRHLCAVFLERLFQIAFHQAQPIGIGQHLVLGVDTGHAVLAIHDRTDRRLHPHIGQPRLIARANRMGAVKDQLHMQPIVDQKHRLWRLRIAGVARELRRIGQRLVIHQQRAFLDVIAAHIGVRRALDREGIIKEHPRAGHNTRAPPPVISAGLRQAAHRIGAVKRIVQAAPTGIGGVQRKARVGDRHDQLRPGDGGDLGVDLRGLNREAIALWNQISDLFNERAVRIGVMGRIAVRDMPLVDLALQVFTLGQKGGVFGGQPVQKFGERRPKRACLHTASR